MLPVTAIITAGKDPDLSTFISSLREGLRDPKDFLYGADYPELSYYHGYILKPSFSDRLKRRLQKKNWKKFQFERYLVKKNIKTILAEYGTTAASIVDSCKKLNINLITHFHGFDAYETNTLELYHKSYLEVFKHSRYIVSVSKAMTKQLITLGAPEEKLVYAPCAPEDEFYLLSPDYHSNVLISIGRFVDKKAPYYTILAFDLVLRNHPEMKLKMIGDGPLLNTCINLAGYLGISDSIQFLGKLNQKEVLGHMESAFCFVQHSLTAINGDSEGTPVAVLEAGASALPVISTMHAGIPDVHIHGKTALLSQEKSVDQMALNLELLINDRTKARLMGENGRVHIRSNYSMSQYINTIQGLLE